MWSLFTKEMQIRAVFSLGKQTGEIAALVQAWKTVIFWLFWKTGFLCNIHFKGTTCLVTPVSSKNQYKYINSRQELMEIFSRNGSWM